MSSPSAEYKIISDGTILDGFERAEVIRNLQALFGISEDSASHLFRSRHSIIKAGLSENQATRYCQRLTDAGVRAEMVAVTSQHEPEPQLEPESVAGSAPESPAAKVELSLVPAAGATEALEAAPPPWRTATDTARSARRKHRPLTFTGDGREYFGIWIVNVLLTIVTLGIYSAWATVRNRQYFYGHTQLDGASFQYLASPVAILKGRAIALGALLVYAAVTELSEAMGMVLFLVLMALMPWVIVRSLKFNATNSAYRNVRFGFGGGYGEAARVSLLWPVLSMVSLFLLAPLSIMRSDQFRASGSRYGATYFQLGNRSDQYYRCFGKFALMVAGFALVAWYSFIAVHPLVTGVVLAVGILVTLGYYQTRFTNLYINGVTLDDHRLESRLELRQMLWLYFSNSFLVLITAGLYIPFAKVRMARYRAACTAMKVQGDLNGFVATQNRRVGALGEELGDAFDIGFAPI